MSSDNQQNDVSPCSSSDCQTPPMVNTAIKKCRTHQEEDNLEHVQLPDDFKFSRSNSYNLKRFRLEYLIQESKTNPDFHLTNLQLAELQSALHPWKLLPGKRKRRTPKGDTNYGMSMEVERMKKNKERIAILQQYGQVSSPTTKSADQHLDDGLSNETDETLVACLRDARGRFTGQSEPWNPTSNIDETDNMCTSDIDGCNLPLAEELTKREDGNPNRPQYLSYFDKCKNKIPNHPGYSHKKDWKTFKQLYKQREGKQKVEPKNIRNGDWRPISELTPQTFHVTHKMMKNMKKFIAFTEYLGADAAGAIIVVPPADWQARPEGYDDFQPTFRASQQYPFAARDGSGSVRMGFEQLNRHEYTLENWYKIHKADLEDALLKTSDTIKDEYQFRFDNNGTQYGKDVEMTGFDEDMSVWNVNDLDSWFRRHGGFSKTDLKDGGGLIRSFLYVSTLYSSFADHIEDFSAYSINFNHIGADKLWRIIPPSFYLKYLDLLQEIHQKHFNEYKCKKFTRHKQLMVPDYILEANGIRYNWICQPAGSFVITYPNAWHSGIATGMSIGEASNIAFDKHWMNYAVFDCGCRKRICGFGENTTMSIKGWVKAAFGENGLNDYLAGRLKLKNPALLPFQKTLECPVPFLTRKPNGDIEMNSKENPIPIYPLIREKEDLKTAYHLRHFYDAEEEIGQEIDRSQIMKLKQ